jgi:hypothetical protein
MFETGGDIRRLFEAGLNVIVSDFRESIPEADAWLSELGAEIGLAQELISLTAFATPASGNGAEPHLDAIEGLQIQLAGRKRMSLAPERVRFAGNFFPGRPVGESHIAVFGTRYPRRAPKPLESVELRPGSAAYIPRGYWHSTVARGPSFAITIGFRWPTAIDVLLPRLRLALLRDSAWRAPLIGCHRSGAGVQANSKRIDELVRSLKRGLARVDGEDAIAASHDTATRVNGLRDGQKLLRCPARFQFRRSGRERELAITSLHGAGETVFDIESNLAGPCRWIGSLDRAFSIGELRRKFPDVEPDAVRELLAALVGAEALQFMPWGL